MRRLHISWSGLGLLLLFIFTTGQEADWNSSVRQGPWMGVSSVQRSESFNGDGTARNMTKYMLTLTGRRGEMGERGDGGEMGERVDEGSLQPSESFVGDLELDWIPGSTPTLQGPSTRSSPQAGLTVAGHADREVPLLPEEEPDNRRDMSGTPQSVDHVTTGYNPAGMNTHTDTHTDTHTLPMDPARMNTHTDTHTHSPTDQHTHSPTDQHTHSPTDQHTHSPTHSPTDQHTHSPTDQHTHSPTHSPTDQHTHSPTHSPTDQHTHSPTDSPTHSPTDQHTHSPTDQHTHSPTDSPTDQHTHSPTDSPTDSPTHSPTDSPADQHTHSPTDSPTDQHTSHRDPSISLPRALRLPLSLTSSPLAGPGKPGRTLTPQRYTLAGLTERGRPHGGRSTRSVRVGRGERGPGMTPDPEGLKVTSEVTLSQTSGPVTEGLPESDITSRTPTSSSPDPDRSNQRQTTRTEINSGMDSSFSLETDITSGSLSPSNTLTSQITLTPPILTHPTHTPPNTLTDSPLSSSSSSSSSPLLPSLPDSPLSSSSSSSSSPLPPDSPLSSSSSSSSSSSLPPDSPLSSSSSSCPLLPTLHDSPLSSSSSSSSPLLLTLHDSPLSSSSSSSPLLPTLHDSHLSSSSSSPLLPTLHDSPLSSSSSSSSSSPLLPTLPDSPLSSSSSSSSSSSTSSSPLLHTLPDSPLSSSSSPLSPDRDRDYNGTTNPFISSPFTTAELPLGDVVQTIASPLTPDQPLLVTTTTSTTTTDSESQWPETDTPLLSHTHATHTPEHTHAAHDIQTHTPLLDMSPAHTPLSQTPVLSSTAVSPPSPLNPIQDHTATHPDHSVLTPTPTALTSPSGPNTTPLYSFVTTSPVVTTTTTTQPSLITKQPSTTTTQPISSTQSFPRLRTTRPPPWTAPHPNQGSPSAGTSSGLSPSPPPSTISSTHRPRVFILPDRPATIKEESIELLLQVILEESSSDPTSSLEDDTTSWVTPYLQRAPGFQDLQGVWSSGRAVQSVLVFRTSGALAWLGVSGAGSLLERTGLAQAVREGRSFRGSKVTNVTVGGVQDDVCLWLFNCPAAGFECLSRPGHMAVCSSVCHSDYCHNQGICTHHPHQPPLCQCPVGDHFWFMGRRCDVRMTQQRLVGACLGVLVAIVTLIGAVAWLAVRRYRAMLIKTKVDQTRSRFNHFDELSGRFWGRSIGGSADSLDNPVFTRSDELLHRRALDRTCCYHDDTLSLASTCPSNGTHLNTVYPHNSQYGWAVSEVSLAECVLDSGKASDLSVCSWPIEPIQWTPFPLLQQLSSTHRTTPVRALRPRSYCEGMELVELEKSWTA